LLRPYGLVGIRGDTDFLLWQVARISTPLVELQTRFKPHRSGAYLSIPYSYLAMTRRTIYEFRLIRLTSSASSPASCGEYLFVSSVHQDSAWYALPKPERSG